jgi:hypothetical protein
MSIDDIDQEEFKRLLSDAKISKLSYLDSELEQAINQPGKVSVLICRLDDTNWITALSYPNPDALLTWSAGERFKQLNRSKYEPDALVQEIYKATTSREQNQPRLIILPISTQLKLTKGRQSHWQAQGLISQKTELGQIIAEQVTNFELNGPIMDLLRDKLPNIVESFDPFEL